MSLSSPVLRRALLALGKREVTTFGEFVKGFGRGKPRGRVGRCRSYLARLKKWHLALPVHQVMIHEDPVLVGYTLTVLGRERLDQLRDLATVQQRMFA